MLSVELNAGAQTHDPEIVTAARIKSLKLKRLSHPGASRIGVLFPVCGSSFYLLCTQKVLQRSDPELQLQCVRKR